MQRGEVYYADLTLSFGSEQGGSRPCVILQNDIGNRYSGTTIIAPMTASLKRRLPTHVQISTADKNLDSNSVIMLEQIRVVDKARFGNFICRLSRETMERVDKAIEISLALHLNKEERGGEEMKNDIPNHWKSIYIMQSEYGDVKIGISKNVDKRKRTIESNRMSKITNCYKTKPCSNAHEIENAMHRFFSNKRIYGEWFSCDMGTAIRKLDNLFLCMAKFEVKDYSKSVLDGFMREQSERIRDVEEYIKSMEKTIEAMKQISSKKDECIERLISMVEQLQSDSRKRNDDMKEIEDEYYYSRFLLNDD